MTHPPPGPPSPPRPGGPKHDNLFALAASLGFKDLGHRGPQGEPPATPPVVAADSEGRTGGSEDAPGAVPSLPPMPPVPPWVASRRRLAELGVGPVYHGLPKLR